MEKPVLITIPLDCLVKIGGKLFSYCMLILAVNMVFSVAVKIKIFLLFLSIVITIKKKYKILLRQHTCLKDN